MSPRGNAMSPPVIGGVLCAASGTQSFSEMINSLEFAPPNHCSCEALMVTGIREQFAIAKLPGPISSRVCLEPSESDSDSDMSSSS